MSVVDASVWVSVSTVEDVHHESSFRWLNHQLAGGSSLLAPTLAIVEVAGAISRRRGSTEYGHEAVDYVSSVPGIRFIELDSELGAIAARLAADLQLRGADAIYVAVAHVLEFPLITWDQELVMRASSLISVSTPGNA